MIHHGSPAVKNHLIPSLIMKTISSPFFCNTRVIGAKIYFNRKVTGLLLWDTKYIPLLTILDLIMVITHEHIYLVTLLLIKECGWQRKPVWSGSAHQSPFCWRFLVIFPHLQNTIYLTKNNYSSLDGCCHGYLISYCVTVCNSKGCLGLFQARFKLNSRPSNRYYGY